MSIRGRDQKRLDILETVCLSFPPIHSYRGAIDRLFDGLFAIFCWAVLTAFAGLSGIGFAAGILGRDGKISGVAWGIAVFLGLGATALAFVPEPNTESGVYCGLLALASIGISVTVTILVLRMSRRNYLPPMAVEP